MRFNDSGNFGKSVQSLEKKSTLSKILLVFQLVFLLRCLLRIIISSIPRSQFLHPANSENPYYEEIGIANKSYKRMLI